MCPKISDCSPRKDEVCGSDGKTYHNDCSLRVEACAKGEDITVTNLAPCGKSTRFLVRMCDGCEMHFSKHELIWAVLGS